jgi:hypothetical protein
VDESETPICTAEVVPVPMDVDEAAFAAKASCAGALLYPSVNMCLITRFQVQIYTLDID